jgi:tetratricopeptide (TPR) repeat protein
MADRLAPTAGRRDFLGAALAHLEGGRFAQADAQAARWLARAPADVEATLLRGLALAGVGRVEAAAALLQQVAAARPEFAHPCRDLARFVPDDIALRAAAFRACRRLAPEDARLACAYAEALLDANRPAPAAAVLRQVLAQARDYGPAHTLYGMALLELCDPEGAVAAFRRAARLTPDEAATWANLGMALKIMGQLNEALVCYDVARARAPGDARIRLNRAIALLRAGRMAEAWEDYDSRLLLGPAPRLPPGLLLPTLTADADLRGCTVLVWHEEGFGDTLQFARYLPLLAARGARVIAYVPRELARLFATLRGPVEILAPPAPTPGFDFHVPFFSLPRVFATTLETIPAELPYLAPTEAELERWSAALPRGGLRVGLAWAGQARPWAPGFVGLDARRSIPLEELARLARVPGLRWVSLQMGPAAAALRDVGWEMANPMPQVRDFADTAGIVASLDVVVSVDTSVAHLAGAVGKPVLLLDRYDSCWRWLAGREDSPWYPSLRILRQERMGDWAPVVLRAGGLLAGWAARD